MNEIDFVARREKDWQRLSYLCDRADASATQLTGEGMEEFVRLYRAAARDLARVRTESANLELAAFLNALVGRAYGQLYARPHGTFLGGLRWMLRAGAEVVRRRVVYVAVSLVLFVSGIAFGASVLEHRPDLRWHVVPDGWEEVFELWRTGRHTERTLGESVAMMGFYSSNNPRAAIMTAALSAATFGVGTAYVLITNGMLIGALGHDMTEVGKLPHLVVSVSPHGATELSGLVLAGAAGLVMGWALIAPGRRSRGESLREAGKDAFVLMVSAIAMMFLAAPFEAFFSFNPDVPEPLKVVVAAIVFAGWVVYWVFYGREQKASPTGPTGEAH
jgi:uncharacterized membrane protein SpoIIM required for sporulation